MEYIIYNQWSHYDNLNYAISWYLMSVLIFSSKLWVDISKRNLTFRDILIFLFRFFVYMYNIYKHSWYVNVIIKYLYVHVCIRFIYFICHVGYRFFILWNKLHIAGSVKCSTKPLFELLTCILSAVKTGLQRYCDTSYLRGDVNHMSTLKNSKDQLEYIQYRSLTSCNSIKTFVFSTFYTTIPQSKPKDRSRELVQMCFIKRMVNVDINTLC